MTIRLYFDEDSMHRGLARALRARGVDVVTALEAGMIERESDYLSQGKRHAGIILMRQQRFSVGEQMRRLLRLIASKSADEMENWIEFLSAWGR